MYTKENFSYTYKGDQTRDADESGWGRGEDKSNKATL